MSRTPQSQTPRPVPSAPGVLRATPPLITASPSAPSADTMRRRSSASLLAPPVVTVPVRRQAGGSSSLAVPPSGDRPDRRGSTTPLFSAASTPGGVGPTRISQPQALPTDSGSLQESNLYKALVIGQHAELRQLTGVHQENLRKLNLDNEVKRRLSASGRGANAPYTPDHKNRLPDNAKSGLYTEDTKAVRDSLTGLKQGAVFDGSATAAYLQQRLAPFEGKMKPGQRDRLIFGSDKTRQNASEEQLRAMRPQRYLPFNIRKEGHRNKN